MESRHDFKDAAGLDTIVGVKLSISQRRNFTVESPIDKDVVYNEEMVQRFRPTLICLLTLH